nr:reverse transcriptase domain-containing protein [Tanacetum cinerariifolium]
MSTRLCPSPTAPTSVVQNTVGHGKEISQGNLNGPAFDAALREYCDNHYNQLLPILDEKIHQEKVQQEKLKAVKARLNFEEDSQHSESGTPSRMRDVRKRLGSRRIRSVSGSPEGATDSRYPEKEIRKEKRLWFDDLPPESVDSYDDLKEAFLVNFHQQKKCIKDPVEIHYIKQKEGESMEDFVRRFKVESRDVKWAPEIMRILRFMHGITKPKLIKRLHDKILKSVDEMIRITTSFLRGEVAAGNQERKKSLPQ